MAIIEQPIQTVLKAHSTQIAFAGTVAQIALDNFGVQVPWWGLAGLFALVLLGRVIKQPSISGAAADEMDQLQ